MKSKYLKILLIGLLLAAITGMAFLVASTLEENQALQNFIRSTGILGVMLVGLIGGLNAVVPIPPATFAPLFMEAGLSPVLIITGFAIGTTVADSISYLLGWFGRDYVHHNHPKIKAYLQDIFKRRQRLLPVVIFGYFALAPLPNEIILIPLALLGYPYKKLWLPLIIGNVFHHSVMVLGYAQIFSWFF